MGMQKAIHDHGGTKALEKALAAAVPSQASGACAYSNQFAQKFKRFKKTDQNGDGYDHQGAVKAVLQRSKAANDKRLEAIKGQLANHPNAAALLKQKDAAAIARMQNYICDGAGC